MSYSFKPMSDEEIAASVDVLEYGIYDFEVMRSCSKISKSNNTMAELNLKVYDKQGNPHFLYDYLVFSTIPLNIKKVKHFCDAVGLQEEYKKGELPEDLARYSGKLELGIQDERRKTLPDGNPHPDGGFYPKKNIVLDYVKEGGEVKKSASNDFKNDDLPF